MGFFSDLAKGLVSSIQERAQAVSARKQELEQYYSYRRDDELFQAMSRMSPTSIDAAATSLILQDRGYSSDEILEKCRYYKTQSLTRR